MANALYPLFKQALLNKEHDLNTDTIKAMLVDSLDYTYSTAHVGNATATGDVPSTGKSAQSGALTSPTIVEGKFDTADFTWSAVSATEDVSEQIILFNDTPPTKPLIVFYDTGMTGMPVTPSGGDINVTINASGWFTL